ncbi:MAG: hypothetical protein EXR74_05265 [Bdellovibrionales bacterium]|nr:hypothetical protein [Bdellovibrionales bacterium]
MTSPIQSRLLQKKIFLGFCSIVGIVILILAAIPLWFDVDHYRPQMVSVSEEFLNGKLTLGKLTFSVWGKLRFKVDGLALTDLAGEKILAVKYFEGEISLPSIFSKSPCVVFTLDKPEINITKSKQGKINLLDLVKIQPDPLAHRQEKINQESESRQKKSSEALPSVAPSYLAEFIKRLQVDLRLTDAQILYRDPAAEVNLEFKKVNIEATHFSLLRPSQIMIAADLETRFGKSLLVKGPFELKVAIDFRPQANDPVAARVQASSDLTKLEIVLANGFQKKKGEAASFLCDLVKTSKDIKGDFSFEVPGFQLSMKTKMVSFDRPQGDIQFSSAAMDLDKILGGREGSESAKTDLLNKKGSSRGAQKVAPREKTASLDEMLLELRRNSIFKNSIFNIKLNFKNIKTQGIRIPFLESFAILKGGVISLKQLKIDLLGGQGTAIGELDLMTPIPTYRLSADFKGLQLAQAIDSQSELLKNSVIGKAQFQFSGKGEGLNPEMAKTKFSGKGSFKVTEARFISLDVGRWVGQGMGPSFLKVVEQVPLLKGKQMPSQVTIESRYDFISSDFTINKGILEAPNFIAKAVSQKGLDLKGLTELTLKDCGLKARWQVIDTYNLTKARDISLEQGGIKIEHLLAEGTSPVSFPIEIDGTCQAPQFNYEAMSGPLIKVALKNVAFGVSKRLTQELGKSLQTEIIHQAGKPLGDALKHIFGK